MAKPKGKKSQKNKSKNKNKKSDSKTSTNQTDNSNAILEQLDLKDQPEVENTVGEELSAKTDEIPETSENVVQNQPTPVENVISNEKSTTTENVNDDLISEKTEPNFVEHLVNEIVEEENEIRTEDSGAEATDQPVDQKTDSCNYSTPNELQTIDSVENEFPMEGPAKNSISITENKNEPISVIKTSTANIETDEKFLKEPELKQNHTVNPEFESTSALNEEKGDVDMKTSDNLSNLNLQNNEPFGDNVIQEPEFVESILNINKVNDTVNTSHDQTPWDYTAEEDVMPWNSSSQKKENSSFLNQTTSCATGKLDTSTNKEFWDNVTTDEKKETDMPWEITGNTQPDASDFVYETETKAQPQKPLQLEEENELFTNDSLIINNDQTSVNKEDEDFLNSLSKADEKNNDTTFDFLEEEDNNDTQIYQPEMESKNDNTDKFDFLEDDDEILFDDIMDDDLLDDNDNNAEQVPVVDEPKPTNNKNRYQPQSQTPVPVQQNFLPNIINSSTPLNNAGRQTTNFQTVDPSNSSFLKVDSKVVELQQQKKKKDAYDFPQDLLAKTKPKAPKIVKDNIYTKLENSPNLSQANFSVLGKSTTNNSETSFLPPTALNTATKKFSRSSSIASNTTNQSFFAELPVSKAHQKPALHLKNPYESIELHQEIPPVSHVAPSAAKKNPYAVPTTPLVVQSPNSSGPIMNPKKSNPYSPSLENGPNNSNKYSFPVGNQLPVNDQPNLFVPTTIKSSIKRVSNPFAPAEAGGHIRKLSTVVPDPNQQKPNIVPVPMKSPIGITNNLPTSQNFSRPLANQLSYPNDQNDTFNSINDELAGTLNNPPSRYAPQNIQSKYEPQSYNPVDGNAYNPGHRKINSVNQIKASGRARQSSSIAEVYGSNIVTSSATSTNTRKTSVLPPTPIGKPSNSNSNNIIPAPVVINPENLVKRQWPLFSFSGKGNTASVIPSYGMYGQVICNINVTDISSILKADSLVVSFPGPLSKVKTKKKDLIKWLDEKIDTMSNGSNVPSLAEDLIWKCLRVMLEKIEKPNDFEDENYIKSIVNIMNPSLDVTNSMNNSFDIVALTRSSQNISHEKPFNAYSLDSQDLATVHDLLEKGNKKAALELAIDLGDWAMALLISNLMGSMSFNQTIKLYTTTHFESNTIGQNLSFFIESKSQGGITAEQLKGKESWLTEHFKMVVPFIIMDNPDYGKTLMQIGDALYKAGYIIYAKLSYILSGLPMIPKTLSELPDSIYGMIIEEIYDYILTSSSSIPQTFSNGFPHMIPLKIRHAGYLADTGSFADAKRYCDFTQSEIASKQLFCEPATMIAQNNLSDRLSQVGSSWLTSKLSRPQFERVWTTIDKSFNKFVAGEDVPQIEKPTDGVFSKFTSPVSLSRNPSTLDLADVKNHISKHVNTYSNSPKRGIQNIKMSNLDQLNTLHNNLNSVTQTRPLYAPPTIGNELRPREKSFDSISSHSTAQIVPNKYAPPSFANFSSESLHSITSQINISTTQTPGNYKNYGSAPLQKLQKRTTNYQQNPYAPTSNTTNNISPLNQNVPLANNKNVYDPSVQSEENKMNQPHVPFNDTTISDNFRDTDDLNSSLTRESVAQIETEKLDIVNQINQVPQFTRNLSQEISPKLNPVDRIPPLSDINTITNRENQDGIIKDSVNISQTSSYTSRIENLHTISDFNSVAAEADSNAEFINHSLVQNMETSLDHNIEEATETINPVGTVKPVDNTNTLIENTGKENVEEVEEIGSENIIDNPADKYPVTSPNVSSAFTNSLTETDPEESHISATLNYLKEEEHEAFNTKMDNQSDKSNYKQPVISETEKKTESPVDVDNSPIKKETELQISSPKPLVPKAAPRKINRYGPPGTTNINRKKPKNPYASVYAPKANHDNVTSMYSPNPETIEMSNNLNNENISNQQVAGEDIDMFSFGGYSVPAPTPQQESNNNLDNEETEKEKPGILDANETMKKEQNVDETDSDAQLDTQSNFSIPTFRPPTQAGVKSIKDTKSTQLNEIFTPPAQKFAELSTKSIGSPIHQFTEEKKFYAADTGEFYDDVVSDSDDDGTDKTEKQKEEEKRKARIEAEKKKAEEEEKARKKKEEQSKKDSKGDSNGWFGWLGKGKNDDKPKPIKAKLGEENAFYYDEKLKRWINSKVPLEEQIEASKPPPPPTMKKPVTTAPGSTSALNSSSNSESSIPTPIPKMMNSSSAPPLNKKESIDDLLKMKSSTGAKRGGRRGPRRGYVDVMGQQ